MLGFIASQVKTVKEIEKMLSLIKNFTNITGLGKKKKEKGELVLKKVTIYSFQISLYFDSFS